MTQKSTHLAINTPVQHTECCAFFVSDRTAVGRTPKWFLSGINRRGHPPLPAVLGTLIAGVAAGKNCTA